MRLTCWPGDSYQLRTANAIESVFATVRHRTVRIKPALSQDTTRPMVAKTWRRLKAENHLLKVVQGVTATASRSPIRHSRPPPNHAVIQIPA